RCRRIAQLAHPVVEPALAAADAPGVEAQHGKATIHEHVEQRENHLVVHRPAVLRVGMEDQRDRRMLLLALMIAALKATFWAGKHHVRHRDSDYSSLLAAKGRRWWPTAAFCRDS